MNLGSRGAETMYSKSSFKNGIPIVLFWEQIIEGLANAECSVRRSTLLRQTTTELSMLSERKSCMVAPALGSDAHSGI